MSELGPGEVARLARLARLELAPEEAAALAAQLARIAHEFEGLRSHARGLEASDPPGAGALREDAVAEAGPTDAILAQVPRLDASRKVRVEKP